jgi:lipid II:glycine glycyltransferase (peptidoglycan interpeptide bridge formation enzyme)
MTKIVDLAKKNNAGWIRIEPENVEILNLIRKSLEGIHPRRTKLGIWKAPHDMQPREILVMDISKSEEELLAGMKSKTRYNIKLAEKHGVKVCSISNSPNYLISNNPPAGGQNPNDKDKKYYVDKFIELVKLTADRKGINFHPANYYRKMLEIIPGDILKLYVAEYENKIIAAKEKQ